MKIAIIGYSGSGKSTLAARLGQIYDIPVLHMDTLQFEPGWQDRPQETVAKDLQDFLEKNKSWVIDGNYSFAHYERRMAEAIRLSFSIFLAGRVCLEHGDATEPTREKLARVWLLAALKSLTGNLSAGSSGMGERNQRKAVMPEYVRLILLRSPYSLHKKKLIIF